MMQAMPFMAAHEAKELEEGAIVRFAPILPTNYLQIRGVLPAFTEMELLFIQGAIKDALERVTDALEILDSPRNNKESKIVARLSCCLAYFDLGQQYAKKGQAYFIQGNAETGLEWAGEAEQAYLAVEEFKWDRALEQYYNKKLSRKTTLEKPLTKWEALEKRFDCHSQMALLYFLAYQHRPAAMSKIEAKPLLDKFLKASDLAFAIQKDHADLWFIRTVFLIDFLSVPFSHKPLRRQLRMQYMDSARAFLKYSPDDENRRMIAFTHQVFEKMFTHKGALPTYEATVPLTASPEMKHFFANVYFESIYAQFEHQDLLVFTGDDFPEHAEESSLLSFDDMGMQVSIANLYKFMAHFRNITAQFQVAANPQLNADILDALRKNAFLDIRGNIKSDLSDAEEALFVSLLHSIYQVYFPGKEVSLESLSPKALSEQMVWRCDRLEELYDGLSPEMALFLLGKSLSVLPEAQCSAVDAVIGMLKSALQYRTAPLFAEVDDRAVQFQSGLVEGQPKILLVTTPVLIKEGAEYRHSLYAIFHQAEAEITIQIINAGLGVEQFHYHPDGHACVRQVVLPNTLHNQELLLNYLGVLFGLSAQQVATTSDWADALSPAYHFNGVAFDLNPALTFPAQVTGNCTVFGAQWACRIALGLSESEHDKLTLDFARGTDLLATHVRAGAALAVIPEKVIPEGLPEDRIKFPCGYTSIARKKFPAPGSHSTPEYAPGISGTNHHILPQSYLQFLYDEISGSDPNLLCDVLGKPHGTAVTKKQFAYGHFDLFHGPKERSDDPEDSKSDPYGGVETKPPIGFPGTRWGALQTIATTLKTALTTPGLSAVDKTSAIVICKTQLQEIAKDPTRTTDFKEAVAGSAWETDPADATKYRLKTPAPAPVPVLPVISGLGGGLPVVTVATTIVTP